MTKIFLPFTDSRSQAAQTYNDWKKSGQPQFKSNQTSLFHKQLPQKGRETLVSHTMPKHTSPYFTDLRWKRTAESPQELPEGIKCHSQATGKFFLENQPTPSHPSKSYGNYSLKHDETEKNKQLRYFERWASFVILLGFAILQITTSSLCLCFEATTPS